MFKVSNKESIHDSTEILKNANKKTSIPSIVNAGMVIKGNVSGDIIEIFGTINGDVECEVLSIRENAKVIGKIVAKYVKISGLFEGEVNSSIIHITSHGQASGKFTYGIISIEEKAKFNGDLIQQSELLEMKESEEIKSQNAGGD